MNFFDFARQNPRCHLVDNGFVLWAITDADAGQSVLLEDAAQNLIVHVLLLEGSIQMRWADRMFSLNKGCFANFIDKKAVSVSSISNGTKAYMMISTIPFITTFIKENPPFPPAYILKIKVWPVFRLSAETTKLFHQRVLQIVDILSDNQHHFQQEMMKCALWMWTMDIANEFYYFENEEDAISDSGRKHILFQKFIKLLFLHIREHHSVGWYASQLCVTPQYLNRAVKATSERTASEHICITLVRLIVEQLENTQDSVSQIADEFHFPDLATLTKFFKRHTGITPTEHRKATQ
ncbi:MAG: helix-turn-helix domain-containing protein [Sodaliphilus sp.]